MEETNQTIIEVSISPSVEITTEINEVSIQVEIEEGLKVETTLIVSPAFEFTIENGARGKSAYEVWISQGNIGSELDFFNSLKGERGIDGRQGIDGVEGIQGIQGLSAYQIWLQAGYLGTEEDYLNSLKVNSYTHYQMSASEEWLVEHNMGKFPSVSIVDSAKTVVIGDITYIDLNILKIGFMSAFSGKAYLN